MGMLDSLTLKAVSTSTRQEMIKLIAQRPYTASELSRLLDKHVTTVAEHLQMLEKSGLVYRSAGKKWVYYKLTQKGEGLVKPGYARAVLISSIISLVLAGYFYTIGGYFYTTPSGSEIYGRGLAIEAAKDAAPAAEQAAQIAQPMNMNLLIGTFFVLMAALGLAYVAWKHLRASTLTNPTV